MFLSIFFFLSSEHIRSFGVAGTAGKMRENGKGNRGGGNHGRGRP